MLRKEPGYDSGSTMMSIHGFGIGIGGSISLPNLRRSCRKMDLGYQSEIRPFLPPIKPQVVAEIDFKSRHPFRSCSSPSIMRSSELPCRGQTQHPIPIPVFGAHDGFRKGSQVANSSEMIIGALTASHDHFQRGMHHADVMELVCSAYKLSNSSFVIQKLNTTLEKLVATGIVSKSYGVKNKDATYRLVMYNPKLAAKDPKLIVSGTGIKASAANPRSRSGLCLPGSSSHLTRVARTCPSEIRGNKIGDLFNRQDGNNQIMQRAYASMSDPTLARSLADRSGAREHLQSLEYRPSSPVSSKDLDEDIPGIGDNSNRFPIDFSKEASSSSYGEGDYDDGLSNISGCDQEIRPSSSDILQRLRVQEYASQLASIGTFDDEENKFGRIGLTKKPHQIGAHGFSEPSLSLGRKNENEFSQNDMVFLLERCRFSDSDVERVKV